MPYADPEKDREYHRDYGRSWDRANPEARQAIQARHDAKRSGTARRRQQNADVRQRRHIRQRVLVIESYGGCCAFCGNGHFEHLTIDHINGGGKVHRASFGPKYRNVYDYLARTELRLDLYRILCWNCHMALTLYSISPEGEPLRSLEWWKGRGALRRTPNG